jgi:hypothetical protein
MHKEAISIYPKISKLELQKRKKEKAILPLRFKQWDIDSFGLIVNEFAAEVLLVR